MFLYIQYVQIDVTTSHRDCTEEKSLARLLIIKADPKIPIALKLQGKYFYTDSTFLRRRNQLPQTTARINIITTLAGSAITEMLHNQGWGFSQTQLLNEKPAL